MEYVRLSMICRHIFINVQNTLTDSGGGRGQNVPEYRADHEHDVRSFLNFLFNFKIIFSPYLLQEVSRTYIE